MKMMDDRATGSATGSSFRILWRIKTWLRKLDQNEIEYAIYWLSILIIPITAFLYACIYILAKLTGAEWMTQCALKTMTGLPCPGCGGTRAILCLLHGKFLSGLYYHAFAVYAIVLYAIFFLTQTLERLTNGRFQGLKYRKGYLIIALVILVFQYVLKLLIPGYRI